MAQWAVLHDAASVHQPRDASGHVLPGTEQARQVGGDGTPPVAEFAVHELAMLLGLPLLACRNQLADVLDLVHRHPLLWARLAETARADQGGADPALAVGLPQDWQALKVARACRNAGLSREAARWVDARTTRDLGVLPWARFETKLAARILQADPALAEERRRAAEGTKRVSVSRTDDDGLKSLTVRLPAAQIIWLRARLHQVATILQARGASAPLGELEADAAFVLANPAHALQLLLWGAGEQPASGSETFGDRRVDPREAGDAGDRVPHPFDDPIFGDVLAEHALRAHDAPEHEPPAPVDDPGPRDPRPPSAHPSVPDDPEPPATTAPPPAPPPLPPVDPARLRPKVVLHLHGNARDFLTGHDAVLRLENGAPITTRAAIADILGHSHVTVRPVVDLQQQTAADAYEAPTGLAESVRLLHPFTVTPFSTTGSRGATVDLDHTRPFDPGAGSGQTSLDNLGPLTRGSHRFKTFGPGVALAQPVLGVFLWRTRHGYAFQVDHHGTHPLGRLSATQFHDLVAELADPDTDETGWTPQVALGIAPP